jgi:hypothetical protein
LWAPQKQSAQATGTGTGIVFSMNQRNEMGSSSLGSLSHANKINEITRSYKSM